MIVARIRSNRVFFQSPVLSVDAPSRGHPTWYGERFDLKDEKTWHQPNEVAHTTYKTRRGLTIEFTITACYNLLMRGSKDTPCIPCVAVATELSKEKD